MKVLAINGSARRDGNTAVLLRRVMDRLEAAGIETELVQLAGESLEPCRACWACAGQENCVHHNDAFGDIFEKMKAADGIILGSPVYSANVSATMQALIERAAVVGDMNPGLFTHKVGAAVAAARRGGALHAIDTLHHFFLNHEMFVAGATYWNMGYGRLPGEVEKDEEALANMDSLGANIAHVLCALSKMEK
ncbi:MAG: flavodoxin family protein [Peptococcaceae bacterium]|nr:flavodoxin family protein [Peptococcaceae bacterium]